MLRILLLIGTLTISILLLHMCSPQSVPQHGETVEIPKADTAGRLGQPISSPLPEQEEGERGVPESEILYRDMEYAPNIRTVQLHVKDLELSHPILTLNSATRLVLSFDDMDGDVKDYGYTYELCNADWQPSGLSPFEYIDGFSEGTITDYNYSRNATAEYTHYKLTIPNEEVRYTKAGNYLIKVYDENNPERILLTKRFYVVNQKVELEAEVKVPGIPQIRTTHQEVRFIINHKELVIRNPFEEIKVTVRQDNRWDNAVTDLKPLFVREEKLFYNYEGKIVFPGMKEFRYFDIRNLSYLSENVASIDFYAGKEQVDLRPDEFRSYGSYRYIKDANGKFVTGAENAFDPELEADYVMVDFFLPSPLPITNGDIYVFGELSNWDTLEKFKMTYNYDKKQYETSVFLKQGYYNYLYVFKEKGSDSFDTSLIEGNSYETENEYFIYVYHRPFSQRYDELIAVIGMNSLNK